MGLVPMNLRPVSFAVFEPDYGESFLLFPVAITISLAKSAKFSDAIAFRNGVGPLDFSDDGEVQPNFLARSAARGW